VINNRNVTINNFVNRSAVVVVPAGAMAGSRPVREVVQHVDPHVLETARPVIGAEPIRPTAATAGITPRLAQRLHLPPAPAGVAAVQHVAPGPAIHAAPLAHGVAARPVLRNPALRPGAGPEHGAAQPAAGAEHAVPGARPGTAVVAPGAMPAPRTPREREGVVPPAEHAAPGAREAAPREATPAQEVRPRAPPAGAEHPGEVVAHPPAAPLAERPAVVAPHVEAAPQTHATAPEVHAAPRPEEHAAPRPEEHVAPRPEEHAAPRPEVHAAPRPEEHAAPRPEEHAAPRPEVHAAPRPAPAAHEEKKPEQR
jgi:hypothetical protein